MSNIFYLQEKIVSEPASGDDNSFQDISTSNLAILDNFFEKPKQNEMPTFDSSEQVKPPLNSNPRQQIPDMKAKVETIFERAIFPLQVCKKFNCVYYFIFS